MSSDTKTAQAFATSWNNLPEGSVYTREQFEDWFTPLSKKNIEGKRVLELGCGNGSLMVHMVKWEPEFLEGVDLGDSVVTAEKNLKDEKRVRVTKGDLVEFSAPEPFDLVYCIGVLHHLQSPQKGFEAVLRNTKAGGRFHCWVYAKEGNAVVRYIVDPIRKVASMLPWWVTKYCLATPLVAPFYVYAKVLKYLPRWRVLTHLPLYDYALWIAEREFAFFRHVAFDQLVTPQTAYIPKETIEEWLQSRKDIDHTSTYIIMRNGNSWKFGGRKMQDTLHEEGKTLRKLNLGCGEYHKEGYLNVDWQPLTKPDVSHNLNQLPYPFGDSSFDVIEAFHILEHLEKPFAVMEELHRLLASGGVLKLKVPHFSRGFTHAEHMHGFDITFPLYFNKAFTTSGYYGVEFELQKMELHWMAFFHLLPYMGYGPVTISLLKALSKALSFLANLSPAFASRVWCYWVGGFEEIEFQMVCKK